MASVDITNHDICALGLYDRSGSHRVARGIGGTMTLDPDPQSLQVIDLLRTIGTISAAPTPAPVCTVDPEISGTAKVGETLTLGPGVWERADSFAYTWEIGGVPVDGEHGLTLVVPSEAEGQWVTVVVAATGPGGTTSVETEQFGPVVGA